MRVDIVTIFPDYLAPLDLSLPGRARRSGVLDLHVHDLRSWTHDRHRTVDDTPYGGGAGMVMRPEPWGEALDAVLADGAAVDGAEVDGAEVDGAAVDGARTPVLVVPTPAGEPFTQRVAEELASEPWVVVACGRYEGIDQRVVDNARTALTVRELSIGDYVLNGGEVAALVVTEAVVRLLPGFMGNASSLVEESHGDAGLLEYPVYTKPPTWRGLDVPEVLLSGDHARIAAWRRAASLRRTAARRPDLLHAAQVLDDVEVRTARPADSGELMTLQRACWAQVMRENPDHPDVARDALTETLAEVRHWSSTGTVLVALSGGRLVGAVQGRLHDGTWDVGRLMVAPDIQGRGLGRMLLDRVEQAAPAEAAGFGLVTAAGSRRSRRVCTKAGYRSRGEVRPGVVRMTKPRR